jgi:rubrerythrin
LQIRGKKDYMQNRIRRSDFIAGGLVAGGTALAGGVVLGGVATGDAAELSPRDARALQLILLVEYTENAFYREAIERDALQGELRVFARQVAAQERQHLDFVRKALGGQADPRPRFDFGAATREPKAFAETAAELEDLAVAAYNGQATNVSSATLAAAATVVSVEARHAAWIRSISGDPPAPDATDTPQSADDVLQGLEEIGLNR